MDIEYVDILTGENLSPIWVANMNLTSFINFLANCEVHFIRVHKNLVHRPSNYISISTVYREAKNHTHES